MPPLCQVCQSPERTELDRDLRREVESGTLNYTDFARRWKILTVTRKPARDAVRRHLHSGHVSVLTSVVEAPPPDEADVEERSSPTQTHPLAWINDRAQVLLGRAEQLLDEAEHTGTSVTARTRAVREVRDCIKLLADLVLRTEVPQQQDDQPDRPDLDAAIERALRRREAIETTAIENVSDAEVVEAPTETDE